ncbi:conserved hypothetical protein [Theileria equi strain WA]|uniref:Vps53 N-terminal domain-containing protein n=1 Tax=Theileria equi strain WA TaxID=1537102 RepID=L1LG91_THEEQ|nr:conserved hypothetical protein [Theileria equi strain WA]EKX74173.1 conserved hypothetical protein [Theileria equi strain WA]|eukprot:XP_004833625.1 conserved hypothetical protein [Theileria equi strain WA]
MDEKTTYDIDKLLENPVHFINEHFPDEYSLCGIDSLISELNEELEHQDKQLIKMFEEKAVTGQLAHEKFEHLQFATNELMLQINELQEQSKRGESSLKILSSDIRALHNAKINICDTILALKRLIMLSNTLDDLSETAKSRNYKETSGYIVILRELRELVDPLKNAPPVAKLIQKCDSLFEKLEEQLIEDLETALGLKMSELMDDNLPEINNMCVCADALGDSVRKHISQKFSSKLSQDYQNMFYLAFDLKTTDGINHRFSWIRRSINDFDDKYGESMPSSWGIQVSSTWLCMKKLRDQLGDILRESHQTLGANSVLSSLLRCKEFEEELDCRLSQYTNENAQSPESAPIEFPEALQLNSKVTEKKIHKPFKGILSRCFESYLGPWIASEEVQLMDLLARILVDDTKDSAIMMVLFSAKELFSAINTRFQATISISCEQTLFEMFLVFKRLIGKYQQYLKERAEKLQKNTDLKLFTKLSGYVIATCDYCLESIDGLSDEICEIIASAYVELVNFSVEKEKLTATKADAFKCLVDKMCQFSHNTDEIVEIYGPSDELLRNEQQVLESIKHSKEHLPSTYLLHIVNKVPRSLMVHFKEILFSLNTVSDVLGQQLLLDAYELRKFLLEDIKQSVENLPAGYVQNVTSEMDKLQSLTKVLNTLEHNTEAYHALLIENGGSCTRDELDLILKIKKV